MENNEIIQIINKLRKFTHNPNEYKINEYIIKSTNTKQFFSLREIYNIFINYCTICKKLELIEVLNKTIKNYVVKTIITIIKDFDDNNTFEFENAEQRILNNIKINGNKFNNIEELLNAIYEQRYSGDIDVEYVFRFIGRYMMWKNTVEGYEYWNEINRKLIQQYYYSNITKPMNIINKNVLFKTII